MCLPCLNYPEFPRETRRPAPTRANTRFGPIFALRKPGGNPIRQRAPLGVHVGANAIPGSVKPVRSCGVTPAAIRIRGGPLLKTFARFRKAVGRGTAALRGA